MNFPKFGLFSRFFALFGASTILLGLCFVAAYFVMSEEQALRQLDLRYKAMQAFFKSIESTSPQHYQIHQYAEQIKGDIAIERQGQRFSNITDFPSIATLLEHASPFKAVFYAKYHSKYYLLYQLPDGWVAITSTPFNLLVYSKWVVYWPWLLAITILCASYGILRYWLTPLMDMFSVVKQVSKGDFTQSIERIPNNEFAELIQGVNKMIADLNTMFEAKNELLLAVSHELRTPLAHMQVSLAMSHKDKHIEKVTQDIQHMEQLIEQLVEGERLRSGHQALHLTNNYLPALIDEILAESISFQRIRRVGEVPDVVLRVDVGRFKFLIRNLLNNALKHNNNDVECWLEVTADDNNLTLVVADQGRGISKAALSHLFEPFYRVSKVAYRDAKGIGLGLCLCKSIVEAHGGSIEVESKLGKGTRFIAFLPVCQ
ncbi:hypothetical protein PA25_25540 [Pseudoalteromonas sp. A25]|uniref:HAMP domain-containing sensor histidine kinase n=1 Tax=Pseudoalteromonas sp. A25 TaxID=116092 RepID=UPI0012609445|nr:HAMP domain-containing sensor histidine kinase [Pseudoalteromonas sp. A25]BBN82569.1 hypothetical protein PA25_25540 [Pseudoalteromonas sp. A25]